MHLLENITNMPRESARLNSCKMKFKISLGLLLLFALRAIGQESPIDWVNKNAHELTSDSFSVKSDLSFLKEELRGKNIVALGEASHGTHEFYVQKARIISYLISECDFKILSFECPESIMKPINLYLQSGEGDLDELMKDMALYNASEIHTLFMQIRQYNIDKAPEHRVVLTGFDSQDFWGDPFTRDQHMSDKLIRSYEVNKYKTIVWAHNVHIQKDTTAKFMSLGAYLKKQYANAFYAICFDTDNGTVNVWNDDFEEHTFQAMEGSLSNTLAKARYDAFFLPLDRKASPFNGTISLITNIYSNWQEPKPLPIKPGLDFDAMIFIRNTSASIKQIRK